MEWTPFAGLTALDENDSIGVDGGSFLTKNPRITDHLLQVGAVTHHHDAHAALPSPHVALSGAAIASAGTLDALTDFAVTYTVVDQYGGETMNAPALVLTTGSQLAPPSIAPSAAIVTSAGILPAGNYYWAMTYTDGAGGETPIGPTVMATVPAGFASASVVLSALATELQPHGIAVNWRLWRSYEGQDWHLAAQGSSPTFVDGGFDPPDNPARPPTSNDTGATNTLAVTIPTRAQEPALASGTAIRVYLAPDSTFADPCLYAQLPISAAGTTFLITSETISEGSPPHVSLSIPGASQIYPDTDLRFGVKSPVAHSSTLPSGTLGDIRVAVDTEHIWGVLGASAASGGAGWTDLTAIGGGTGSPVGPALGVERISIAGGAIAANGTTNFTVPVPSAWAEKSIHRIVVGLCIQHPNASKLAASLTDPTNDTARMFAAGDFINTNDVGDPTMVIDDPDSQVYFTDAGQGQVPNNALGWRPTEQAGGPDGALAPFASRQYIPHDLFGGTWFGAPAIGNWKVSITESGGSTGALVSCDLYLVSKEFDALIPTPAPLIASAANGSAVASVGLTFIGSGGTSVALVGLDPVKVIITSVGGSGPAGPQGPAGASGAAGPAGASGAAGPQGPAGSTAFVASAGTASATIGPFLGFAASGGASVQLVKSGSSAIVLVGASGLQGPQGAQGPAGTAGAQGPSGGGSVAISSAGVPADVVDFAIRDLIFGSGVSVIGLGGGSARVIPQPPIIAASAGASAVNPDYYTEYAGSGGVSVAVQDLGGGSARVLVGGVGFASARNTIGSTSADVQISNGVNQELSPALQCTVVVGSDGVAIVRQSVIAQLPNLATDMFLGVQIDGSGPVYRTGAMAFTEVNQNRQVTGDYVFTGLTPGSHTFYFIVSSFGGSTIKVQANSRGAVQSGTYQQVTTG